MTANTILETAAAMAIPRMRQRADVAAAWGTVTVPCGSGRNCLRGCCRSFLRSMMSLSM